MCSSSRRLALRGVVLAGAALGLAACTGNSLQSGGLEDPVNTVLGADPMVALGLRADPNAEEIEYTPRSPLVVPSDASQLPPPQQKNEALAANWPDDPDERARRELAEARRAAAATSLRDDIRAADVLSPEELRDWGTRTGDPIGGPSVAQASGPVSPLDLRRRKPDPTLLAGTEPERRDLTEPPAGYRTPATGADGTVIVSQEPEKDKGFINSLFD